VPDQYSPERRTALLFSGTGADGAYHAGVLRALHEAGVKVDLVGGRGIGALAAVLAAVDGGARLWEANGFWQSSLRPRLYRWRWPFRTVAVVLAVLAAILLVPLLTVLLLALVYPLALVLGMAGSDSGADAMRAMFVQLAAAFAPELLPTWIPRLSMLAVLVALVVLASGTWIAARSGPVRRRREGSRAWALLGAPLDAHVAMALAMRTVWDLLKGGASIKTPAAGDLSRRYAERLGENLGQPGFRELLLVVHDLDARRDQLFGLLREPFRQAVLPSASGTAARRSEAQDLGGVARDHVIDVVSAALSVPAVAEPRLVAFGPDSFWRGEVHRLADRPGALLRLAEEAAAAGAEQLIVVSAAPVPPGPHDLRPARVDGMGRVGEQVSAAESMAVDAVVRHAAHRFTGMYVVRPAHNPIRPFDLSGAYDERSDRIQPIEELMQRGYEDAYRGFIEPIVGASGERLTPKGVTG
jgi:hypothetical protein